MKVIQKGESFEEERIFNIPSDFILKSWEHPLIRALHVSDAGYFPRAEHHYRERMIGIEEAILIYCADGSGHIELPMKKLRIEKGTAFCIPPHTMHRYYASEEDPWSIFWIHFKGEQMFQYPIAAAEPVPLNSPAVHERLQGYFIQLFGVLDGSYTQGNFICASSLLSVILGEVYFRRSDEAVDRQHRLLTKAIQYMYRNLDKPIALNELTGYMQLSKSSLIDLFNRLTPHSPIDFFIRLKIQKACKILRLTNKPINEVARALGFDDPFYFSRIFKKITGLSPREYRNGESFYQGLPGEF